MDSRGLSLKINVKQHTKKLGVIFCRAVWKSKPLKSFMLQSYLKCGEFKDVSKQHNSIDNWSFLFGFVSLKTLLAVAIKRDIKHKAIQFPKGGGMTSSAALHI